MSENKPIIIYLSFKNTQLDIELYNFISKHSNKSGWIKDILRQSMKDELSKNT